MKRTSGGGDAPDSEIVVGSGHWVMKAKMAEIILMLREIPVFVCTVLYYTILYYTILYYMICA